MSVTTADGTITVDGASAVKLAADDTNYTATSGVLTNTTTNEATLTASYDTSKKFTAAEELKSVNAKKVSGGNDTITLFNVKEDSTENTTSFKAAEEVSGDNGLVLKFNNTNSLTIESLKGGTSFNMKSGDVTYTYTKEYVTDNDKSVTLYSGATDFTATGKFKDVVSVDGSRAASVTAITGNAITLGAAGGNANGGAGDDTIYANSGADTIAVSKGNDVVENFDAKQDAIAPGSFSITSVDYNSAATTFTFGKNTLKIKSLSKDAAVNLVNDQGKPAGALTTSGVVNASGNYKLFSTAGGTSLTGGSGKDTFEYKGGKLAIKGYEEGEAVNTGSYKKIKDVVISGSNVNLTMTDGNNMLFNYTGRIYNKAIKPTAVSLTSSAGTYDASKDDYDAKIVTIDASVAEKPIKITGNKKNNIIIAGDGGSTLSGSEYSNTLTGGEGKDTFIHVGGSSKVKTTINDYSLADGDVVSVAGLTQNNITSKVEESEVVPKSTSGKLTVDLADGSEVIINSSDYTKTALNGLKKAPVNFSGFSAQVSLGDDAIYNGKSVTLTSAFKGTFDATTKFSSTGVKIDASNVSVKSSSAEIIGTKGKDTIISGGGTNGEATLRGGKGGDSLKGAAGVKDTFYYTTGDGKDVIADFTSNEDVLKLAKKKSLSSASTISGGLKFNMTDGGNITLKVKDAKTAFIKNDSKLYWFEDVDSDGKKEWVTATDSATKKTLKSIMKSGDYAVVDLEYSSWSGDSVKFGGKTTSASYVGASKTASDFSSYKLK